MDNTLIEGVSNHPYLLSLFYLVFKDIQKKNFQFNLKQSLMNNKKIIVIIRFGPFDLFHKYFHNYSNAILIVPIHIHCPKDKRKKFSTIQLASVFSIGNL